MWAPHVVENIIGEQSTSHSYFVPSYRVQGRVEWPLMSPLLLQPAENASQVWLADWLFERIVTALIEMIFWHVIAWKKS